MTPGRCVAAAAVFLAVLGGFCLPAWAGPVIESRVNQGAWSDAPAVAVLQTDTLSLRVRPVEGALIRWFQVAPDLSRFYKNANFPWEADAYQWCGFAKIPVCRREIVQARGKWEVSALDRGRGFWLQESPCPERGSYRGLAHYHPDKGTFRFQAVVEKEGATSATCGPVDGDQRGLSPCVFRLEVRDGPGYLGVLSGFHNVPGLFGSIPFQSQNHIGVDCADVLVAALWESLGREDDRDYNVASLVRSREKVASARLSAGAPDHRIPWGPKGIHPGDWIAVRYHPGGQFAHIGALVGDTHADGVLDAQDEVLHAGPHPLSRSFLAQGAFDGEVVILRHKGSTAWPGPDVPPR